MCVCGRVCVKWWKLITQYYNLLLLKWFKGNCVNCNSKYYKNNVFEYVSLVFSVIDLNLEKKKTEKDQYFLWFMLPLVKIYVQKSDIVFFPHLN